MEIEPFSKRLNDLLGERTQAWLAAQTGLEKSTVSRLMSGAHKPSADTLHRIANALEVSVEALVGGTDAAERIEEKATDVRRSDYDSVVRRFVEEEAKRRDAEACVAALKEALQREREALKQQRNENSAQLDEIRETVGKLVVCEKRLEAVQQELLEKMNELREVGVQNATLHAQIAELAETVRTGEKTSRVAAIMASLAAAAGIGSYFANKEQEPSPSGDRRQPKTAPRRRKAHR